MQLAASESGSDRKFLYHFRWKFNGYGDIHYDFESWIDPSDFDKETERLKRLGVRFAVQRYVLDESFTVLDHNPRKKSK